MRLPITPGIIAVRVSELALILTVAVTFGSAGYVDKPFISAAIAFKIYSGPETNVGTGYGARLATGGSKIEGMYPEAAVPVAIN